MDQTPLMATLPKTHKIFIGLGSNLEQPLLQVSKALRSLTAHSDFLFLKSSYWYASKAVGPGSQPDYINGAVLLESALQPDQVLDILQKIELDQGRERQERWGARTIDLDILLFGDLTIKTERLIIPHPQITNRNFVLLPLIDLDNNLTLPDGRRIAEILHIIGTQNIKKLR